MYTVLKECLWPWPFSWQVWHCLLWCYFIRYEPPHDKTNKMAWDGCPGWSESSLGTHVILLVLSCCGSIIMFVFQRHRVRIIPVTQALYRWKDTDSDFFVYGFEKKVHAPSYPQQCCCGCSLLWDAPSNSYFKKSPWKWRTSPRKLEPLATHWAHSEDSDQTGRMPRLIWVFAGLTVTLLVLSCRGTIMDIGDIWFLNVKSNFRSNPIHSFTEKNHNFLFLLWFIIA